MPRKPRIIKPIPGITFEELAIKDVKKRRKKKPKPSQAPCPQENLTRGGVAL